MKRCRRDGWRAEIARDWKSDERAGCYVFYFLFTTFYSRFSCFFSRASAKRKEKNGKKASKKKKRSKIEVITSLSLRRGDNVKTFLFRSLSLGRAIEKGSYNIIRAKRKQGINSIMWGSLFMDTNLG